MQIDITTI